MTTMRQYSRASWLVLAMIGCASSFCPTPNSARKAHARNSAIPSPLSAHAVGAEFSEPPHVPSFLKPYQTVSGEIINPYHVLQVSSEASTSDIKRSYHKLSRKFHPDMIYQTTGHRLSPEEARNQFERVRFAYGILKDRTSRLRYDRNSALADPAEALERIALHVLGRSLQDSGKLLFIVGEFALEQVTRAARHIKEEASDPALRVAAVGGAFAWESTFAQKKSSVDPMGRAFDTVSDYLGDIEGRVKDATNLVDMGKDLLENVASQFHNLDW